MIKIENFNICGMEHAISGMRNPMNSWDKSDSEYCACLESCDLCMAYDSKTKMCKASDFDMSIGPNDYELMMKLAKGGPVHAKYRRMITVYMDITAPLYWWKEFDTYKVGTVANSCSTMHKIHEKEFTLSDFSHEKLNICSLTILDAVIQELNRNRRIYINGFTGVPGDNSRDVKPKDKHYWWQMIQLLPSSYNQKRKIMLNYEVLTGIYRWRKDHKLDEWREFCEWIEKLPYSEIITGERSAEND